MLMLVFRLGADRYALDATEIVEVLPRVPLKSIPGAPDWVAGLFSYHGRTVPVIDLALLALGRPSTAHVSTRTILVHYPAVDEPVAPGSLAHASPDAAINGLSGLNDPCAPAQRPHVLGVLAEHANRTLRRDPADFHTTGVELSSAPYLGPVATDSEGLLQWIHVPELLPADVRAQLFAAEMSA
jgi:chemotaxis-related protein WspB